MKKTILAVAVMAGLSLNAHANVSDSDLADIDAILGETSSVENKKEEVKKQETKKETKKVDVDKAITKPAENIHQSNEQVNDNRLDSIQKSETEPTIVVPVSGTNFVVEIKRIKDSILKKTLSTDELAISFGNPIDEKYKDEKELVDYITDVNNGKINALNNMNEEPDVLLGISKTVKEGKVENKLNIGTLKYGYNMIVQFLEYDKKNDRIKLRFDYKNIEIASYNSSEIVDPDGNIQKLKVPVLKTTNDSKIFWIKLEREAKHTIKVAETHYVEIKMGRVLPFVQPLVIKDKKKIEEMRIAAEKAKQDAIEAEEARKVKEENDLYQSLEDDLTNKK